MYNPIHKVLMRRKLRLKESKQQKLAAEHKQYNKEMRQIGCHSQQKTLNDFVAWKYGYYQPRPSRVVVKEEPIYVRETVSAPSRNSGILNQCKQTVERVYTGDLVTGVATMHKSNAVPVINKSQATDLATMRR